jgi:hypothetical protein
VGRTDGRCDGDLTWDTGLYEYVVDADNGALIINCARSELSDVTRIISALGSTGFFNIAGPIIETTFRIYTG